MTTNSCKAWILAARPKTLTGAAAPVIVGGAYALCLMQSKPQCVDSSIEHPWIPFLIALLFALIMQIEANFVNDYFDFRKGTDRDDRLGPERACAQGWVTPHAMQMALVITALLAFLVGVPLIFYGGWPMLFVGLACILFCWLYTTHLSYIGLGDVLVSVFFGIVPVCVTYYIQLHTVTTEVVIASLACGLVIDALLLVNNFRDRDTDKAVGKNTLVVRIGEKASIGLYLGVGITACLAGIVFGINGRWWAFILPFVYLVLHVLTFLKINSIWKGRELNKCLGETARNIFMYGLLVSIGLLL